MLGLDLVGAELERLVQRAHGAVHRVGGDDARDLDRGRGDHLDVDALVAERREDLRGDARVRLHARADDGDLAHLGVLGDRADADLGRDRVERRARLAQVRARDRERHVRLGALVIGLVLDDHVDVDVGVGEGREDAAGRRPGDPVRRAA